jgi:hypothetical protein
MHQCRIYSGLGRKTQICPAKRIEGDGQAAGRRAGQGGKNIRGDSE